MTTSLPTDTYYRGYRLSRVREGTPSETVHIYHGIDHIDTVVWDLISLVPTMERAKETIDNWLDAQ